MIRGAAMKTTNPSEVRYCCPECGDDKFHMYYNIRKKVFHCFKCGKRGKFEPERTYSDEQLKEMIAILSGEKDNMASETTLVMPRDCRPLIDGLDINSRFALKYLEDRGLTKNKIKDMNVMLSDERQYDYRVIFPIYGERGEVVFFQTRSFMKSVKPKYLNPIYPKRNALFFNMYRTLLKCKHLFVVEGIFKALRLWEIHEPAVAILGKEMTREQAVRIVRSAHKVTFMLDPDAFKFSITAFDTLRVMGGEVVNMMFPPAPPDDMPPNILKAFIQSERRRRNEVLSKRSRSLV